MLLMSHDFNKTDRRLQSEKIAFEASSGIFDDQICIHFYSTYENLLL